MNVTERPLAFECQGQRLLGVLAESVQAGDLGLLIIVGGPQYRAGSHRQFVMQARSAAAAGVPALRFDVRGMGDSEGELRDFEQVSPDIGAAIDALMQAVPGLRRVVLWGLCDGASAALLYLDESGHDARVQGLCLLNPWVRSEATLAATHVKHYYAQRMLQREFWAKLLRGQVAGDAVRGLLGSLRLTLGPRSGKPGIAVAASATYSQRMARAWASFKGPVLLVLSGNDYTAKEFLHAWQSAEWASARARGGTRRVELPEADHTFSSAASQAAATRHCIEWLPTLA
jgi:uncharacterized protein